MDTKKKLITILILTALVIFVSGTSVSALPKVDEIVSGSVQIELKDANSMNISAANNSIINFSSFDILENESVFVTLPSADSKILNRVTGSYPSDLLGNLSCNGLFILVNESGIRVGPDAKIDVGSLILSTRNITDSNFLKGEYLFEKMSQKELDMLLINEGKITISEGGFGVLIAGAAENRGIIQARAGRIALLGGDAIKLEIAGRGLISVAISEEAASTILDWQGRPITDQVKNTGTLDAAGGTVLLKAENITDVFRRVINLEGFVMADAIEEKDGELRIVTSGSVCVNAEVKASKIVIGDAEEAVPESVSIEGGFLEAEEGIQVLANKVVVSGSDPTHFYGNAIFHNFECTVPSKEIYFEAGKTYTFKDDLHIEGQPGGYSVVYLKSSQEGEPWFINIESGEYTLSRVCVGDSHNINIDRIYASPSSSFGGNIGWDLNTVYWTGSAPDPKWSSAANWDGGMPGASDDVIFDAAHSQDIVSIVDAAFGGTVSSFTIDGWDGTITLERDLTVTGDYSQNAGMFFETKGWTGPDKFDLTVGGAFNRTGGVFFGPAGGVYDYAIRIADIADLQKIDQSDGNLAKIYVQYGNIDASSTSGTTYGFNPIGRPTADFTGIYNGNNYTISNLYINRPASNDAGEYYVALFGRTGGNSRIMNLILSSATITVRNVGVIRGGRTPGPLVGLMSDGAMVINSYYDIGNVTIDGENVVAIGGIYSAQFTDRTSDGKLDITDYLTQDGDGYYEISSVEDMKDFLGFYWRSDCKFRLTSDIDLSGEPNLFIPYLGVQEFDGSGKVISNLTLDKQYATYRGLFGRVVNTDIKNVNIENAVLNITSTGSAFIGSASYFGNAMHSITNCNVAGDVTACVYSQAGGFISSLDIYNGATLTVSDCNADVNIEAQLYSGGFIGLTSVDSGGKLNIIRCSSSGDLVIHSYGTVYPNGYCGSFMGSFSAYNANASVNISDSYATGNISGNYFVSGFIGTASTYNTATCTIENSYATGDVTGSLSAGAFAGWINKSNPNIYHPNPGGPVSVENCYAAGLVDAPSGQGGGFVGRNTNGSYANCFWDSTVNPTLDDSKDGDLAGVTGETTENMMMQGTYAGWDFADTWVMIDYPHLKWEGLTPAPEEPEPEPKPKPKLDHNKWPFWEIELKWVINVDKVTGDVAIGGNVVGREHVFDLNYIQQILDEVFGEKAEDSPKKGRIPANIRWYTPGTYTTKVTVGKGKAQVVPYDESGFKYDEGEILVTTQETEKKITINVVIRGINLYEQKAPESVPALKVNKTGPGVIYGITQ